MEFSRLFSLLTEAPLMIGNDTDFRTNGEWKRLEEIEHMYPDKNYPNFQEKIRLHGNEYEVYVISWGRKLREYVFVDSNKTPVAVYSGETINNGIETDYVETKKGAAPGKSFLLEIYLNFLLKNYKFVMSDSLLTHKAFAFWKNNFDEFIKNNYVIAVYDISTNTSYKITNKNKLDEYWGASDTLANYRFLVRHKKRSKK